MKPNNEPGEDRELREVLREWEAPEIPPGLEARVLESRARRPQRSWGWRAFFQGSIRVPVPVASTLSVLLLFLIWRVAVQPSPPAPCVAVRAPSNACSSVLSRGC